MMIECPRCGFAQPQDQYCASCGVNMEQLFAKPKPFLVRLLQNPNFHLSLIGIFIVLVVSWIFVTQSSVVSREVSRILDLPVSSRNAADPEYTKAKTDHEEATDQVEDSAEEEETPAATPVAATASKESRSPEEILAAAVGAPPPAKPGAAPKNLEISHWEFPREATAQLLASAQRWPDGNGARAFYLTSASKLLETLQSQGQPLGPVKSLTLAPNAQISQETAPTAPEMFQFSLAAQISKYDGKEASLRYSLNLILPQPEGPGETGPTMRQVLEANVSGQGALANQGVLVLVVDSPNRSPRQEYISRAGEGPWMIHSSPEFRSGVTDWLIVFQLK